MEEKLTTLVVHTADRALKLKEILEFHGITVTLEDIVSDEFDMPLPPKKVRIPLASLPLGLKILESGEVAAEPLELIKMTGMGKNLLIPVDFSPLSMLAVRVGFYLAERFGVEPIVMHSYIAPRLVQAESTFFDTTEEELDEETEAVEALDLRKQASARLSRLKKQIKENQRDGALPNIKFSTTLLEGIPEQVIQEQCKANNPLMVVMATRGADKKGSDLIGSVTAEVIDSCRVPVLTIPENFKPGNGIANIRNVALFCNFTGIDVVLIRWLMRTFDFPACKFLLLPVSESPLRKVDNKLDELAAYFSKTYPTATFHAEKPDGRKFDDRVKAIIEKNDLQLIIVPNKKSSAFSRFFRPTLAHKILFEKDVPLLVVPV